MSLVSVKLFQVQLKTASKAKSCVPLNLICCTTSIRSTLFPGKVLILVGVFSFQIHKTKDLLYPEGPSKVSS